MVTRRQMKFDKLVLLLLSGLLASLSITFSQRAAGDGGAMINSAEQKGKSPYPGTEAGARKLLGEFLKSGADHAALTRPLQPTTADYLAVFEEDFARIAETTYAGAWKRGEMVIAPKPGQSELNLWSATSEDLKKWNDKAQPFPGGYKGVAVKFKDGLTIYRFKFVKPGEDAGMAYDGLLYVNGQWRIIPKPWRIAR